MEEDTLYEGRVDYISPRGPIRSVEQVPGPDELEYSAKYRLSVPDKAAPIWEEWQKEEEVSKALAEALRVAESGN